MLRLQSHGLKHFSLWFSFPLRSNRSPPELTKRLQMGFVHDDQMDICLKRLSITFYIKTKFNLQA